MKSTIEVKGVTLTPEKGNLLALANIEIDGAFRVNGLRVLNGTKGPWVSMPGRKKTKDGKPVLKDGKEEWGDIFHGITTEAHDVLQSAVLAAFSAKIESERAQKLIAEQPQK